MAPDLRAERKTDTLIRYITIAGTFCRMVNPSVILIGLAILQMLGIAALAANFKWLF